MYATVGTLYYQYCNTQRMLRNVRICHSTYSNKTVYNTGMFMLVYVAHTQRMLHNVHICHSTYSNKTVFNTDMFMLVRVIRILGIFFRIIIDIWLLLL